MSCTDDVQWNEYRRWIWWWAALRVNLGREGQKVVKTSSDALTWPERQRLSPWQREPCAPPGGSSSLSAEGLLEFPPPHPGPSGAAPDPGTQLPQSAPCWWVTLPQLPYFLCSDVLAVAETPRGSSNQLLVFLRRSESRGSRLSCRIHH